MLDNLKNGLILLTLPLEEVIGKNIAQRQAINLSCSNHDAPTPRARAGAAPVA